MKAAAVVVAAFGLILLAAGLSYGLTGVRIDNGTSCGSAFSADDSVQDDAFSDDVDLSREQCDAARADVLHGALALLVGGIAGLVAGAATLVVSATLSRPSPAHIQTPPTPTAG